MEPVTALPCTARDFPGELSAHYPGACARLDLPPRNGGYALRLAQDAHGARWTIVSRDVGVVSTALSIHAMGVEASLAVDPEDVEHVLPGWPVACPLGFPDRPAPHDPPDSGRVLRPTQPRAWAPTMRRVTADVIAGELLEPVDPACRELGLLNLGLDPADQPPRMIDLVLQPPRPEHEPAVAAALDQARTMARAGAPVGAVREVRSGDDIILVRATSETWSLAARPPAQRAGGFVARRDSRPWFGDQRRGRARPGPRRIGRGNESPASGENPGPSAPAVTTQLAADIEAYVQRMSDADLGRRSARACEPSRELRARR